MKIKRDKNTNKINGVFGPKGLLYEKVNHSEENLF